VTKKRKRPEPPPPEPRTRKAIAICALATFALLAADLGSKAWAEETLSTARFGEPPPVCEPDEFGRVATQRVRTESVVVIEDYVMMRYAENCGAAFGLLRDAPALARKAVFGLAAAAARLGVLMLFG
jgi:lipoprotein signal peptidase